MNEKKSIWDRVVSFCRWLWMIFCSFSIAATYYTGLMTATKIAAFFGGLWIPYCLFCSFIIFLIILDWFDRITSY